MATINANITTEAVADNIDDTVTESTTPQEPATTETKASPSVWAPVSYPAGPNGRFIFNLLKGWARRAPQVSRETENADLAAITAVSEWGGFFLTGLAWGINIHRAMTVPQGHLITLIGFALPSYYLPVISGVILAERLLG